VSSPSALCPIGGKSRGGNFPGSKVTWPELKCIGIRRTCIVDLGWVNMSVYNFVHSGPKVQNFFCSTPKRSLSLTPLTPCRYLHPFQRYLRSNLNVFLNNTKFWTFLPSQIVRGWCPQTLHSIYHAWIAAHHEMKFCWATPPKSKLYALLFYILSQFLTPL